MQTQDKRAPTVLRLSAAGAGQGHADGGPGLPGTAGSKTQQGNAQEGRKLPAAGFPFPPDRTLFLHQMRG